MGRRSHAKTLGLWMNGAFVGTWQVSGNAADKLHYDEKWTTSEQGRPLSLSLPFMPGNAAHSGDKVSAYFENLLPDSKDIRERLARRFNTGSTAAFDLLEEIGRDCVGALQILREGKTPAGVPPIQASPVDDAQVAQILRGTVTPSAMRGTVDTGEEFRISIAGAQEKTALLLKDGDWFVPRGDTPTTHILKLPLGLIGGMKYDMRDSVENEWLCSLILGAYGLPVAACQPMQFEDMKALVVARFDRHWWKHPDGDMRLIRLPQEDMCQATGTSPEQKYEADGGPGTERILQVLDGSRTRERDRRDFFRAQLLFWMLRATDGHAKNFSVFLRPGGGYDLTPLYDVLSAYPIVGKGANLLHPSKLKMAMAIHSKNTHYHIAAIKRRHWEALGTRHGILTEDGRPVSELIDEMAAGTEAVVTQVSTQLPHGFPATVSDPIFSGLLAAAKSLRTV